MSRGAWGDEGNIAERWEDTAQRQEFDEIADKFAKWATAYRADCGPELQAAMDAAIEAMDVCAMQMEGEF